VVVAGAGAFGAWTAWELQRRGRRVLLVDGGGPANARAASGGESRVIRTIYGADELYTRMARDSLEDWRWLSARAGLPVLHATGVLMFFPRLTPYAATSIDVHRALGLPLEVLDRPELARRYPQVSWEGIELGLLEGDYGVVMARRAVQTLVAEFVAAGGEYRPDDVARPAGPAPLRALRSSRGEDLHAEAFVLACGPWLPALLPDLLGSRIFPTRQEVFFFAAPRGDARFQPDRLPAWAEFDVEDMHYGCPDLESRGFKVANDRHGPRFDPETGDRRASVEGCAEIRGYLAKRFPLLAAAPLVETRVCQYENSGNGDLLIDLHPEFENVVLVGAGSGHGFKHGPAVGRYAADLVMATLARVEPRFSLTSKAETQARAVR
jgi:glycine/D-amino acid oxidase-like deaminating enzyme